LPYWPRSTLALALLAGLPASAQRVSVYSEFQRVKPDGEVYSADRVERPREILSPAVARNAWATFRFAIEAPPGAAYTIYIAQNPENSAQAVLYEEVPVPVGEEWVPDELRTAAQPVSAYFPKDRKVQTFLLDIRVPEDAPVRRFRLEIQLWAVDRWVIYPLEVRVRPAMVPAAPGPAASLPAVRERSDSTLDRALGEWVCSAETGPPAPPPPLTARSLLSRNALQDLALMRVRENEETRDGVMGQLLKAGGWADMKALCEDGRRAPRGPEWWLRFRDYLYQGLPVR
jgi:hypothetical protein